MANNYSQEAEENYFVRDKLATQTRESGLEKLDTNQEEEIRILNVERDYM